MNYILYVHEFVNEKLINKDFFSVRIVKENFYITVFLNLDIKTNDILQFKLNRDLKNKSYFKFIKGLPNGEFEMTKEMKNKLLKIIIHKKN